MSKSRVKDLGLKLSVFQFGTTVECMRIAKYIAFQRILHLMASKCKKN